jgi:paraquat-inducible protein B
MSSDAPAGPAGIPADVPVAVVERKRGFSVVWIVPIIAAGIGAWLWWDARQQRGPEITITFSTADGLDAGKTKIRFKSVEVGHVETVTLEPDLSGVVVKARMEHATEPLLHAGSRFWVVRPRIGIGGVSGLDTLLSGAYVEVEPALEGASASNFEGLEVPPETPADAPGLKLKLMVDNLGSISIGSPVNHHGITVGKVEAYHLVPDAERVEIDIYIEPEYSSRVREGSRFWNASGIDISFGAQGIQFQATSLVSLLAGGVEFDTPADESDTPLAHKAAEYHLYANHTASREVFNETYEVEMYFDGSVRGLSVGAPVEFRGIRLGTVVSFALEDKPIDTARTRVVVAVEPERVGRKLTSEETADQRIERLVAAGMRARLEMSSLLTGALYVDIVLDPGSPATLYGVAGEIEIPTVESTSDVLAGLANQVPLIMGDLRRAVGGVADLATSKDLVGIAGDLRAVTDDMRKALSHMDQVFTAMEALLASQSSMQVRLAAALDETAGAMRSVRELANMLDRQPEALIKGKSPSGDH